MRGLEIERQPVFPWRTSQNAMEILESLWHCWKLMEKPRSYFDCGILSVGSGKSERYLHAIL
jgi:hypothetical protein